MIMVRYMNTRMDRYRDEYTSKGTRVEKNKDIYMGIDDEDIDKLNLTTNISVIDTDTSNLDIDKLKVLLDEKYAKKNKKRVYEEVIVEDDELEDTKEYDLKKVIERAHANRESDYDEDRFKKRRKTEYDILSNLNLYNDKKGKEEPKYNQKDETLSDDEKTLIDLIKTVNENSLKNEISKNTLTDGCLLDDLVGDDKTEVLEPINMDIVNTDEMDVVMKKPSVLEELEKTKQLSKTELLIAEAKEIELAEKERNKEFESKQKINEEESLANTFYTGNLSIKDSDLDDFKDLQKELKSNNVLIKMLVAIVVLIILGIICYFVLNKIDLGLIK